MIILGGPPDPVQMVDNFGDVLNKLNEFYQQRVFNVIDGVTSFNGQDVDAEAALDQMETDLDTLVNGHINQTGAVHGETKGDVNLWKVDNFRTATVPEAKTTRDDLFVTPQGVHQFTTATVDKNLYLTGGLLPMSSGVFKENVNFDGNSAWNYSAASDYKKQLTKTYFKGRGQVVLNRDKLFISPHNTTDSLDRAHTWLFVSNAIQEYPNIDSHTDSLNFNQTKNIGFTTQSAQFIVGGTGYNTYNGVTGWSIDDLGFDPAPVTPFDTFLIPRDNLHIGFGYACSAGSTGFTLYCNRFSIARTESTTMNFSSVASVDGNYSAGVYKDVGGVSTPTNFNSPLNLTWDKFITLGTGVTLAVEAIDNGEGYTYTANNSIVWEKDGFSYLILSQCVLVATSGGVSKRFIFKLAFKATIDLADKTKFTLEHLSQQSKAIINSDLTFTSGNILFEEDIKSPFHPASANGAFISKGGHVAAWSTGNGSNLMVKYFKHSCASLLQYIVNFNILPEITDTKCKHLTRYEQGYIGNSITRFVPVKYDVANNQTVAISRCLDAGKGDWGYRWITWNESAILKAGSGDGDIFIEPASYQDLNIDLPVGIVMNLNHDSLLLTNRVFCEENNYTGYDSVLIDTQGTTLTGEVKLDPINIGFFSNYLRGTFKDASVAKLPEGETYKGKLSFRVFAQGNGTEGLAFVIFSDSLCTLSMSACNYAVTDGVITLNVKNAGSYNQFLVNKYVDIPYPTVEVVEPNGEGMDFLTNYDCIFSPLKNSTNVVSVSINNVFGLYKGNFNFTVNGWDGESTVPSNPGFGWEGNETFPILPVEQYGFQVVAQQEIPLALPGKVSFKWDYQGILAPSHNTADYKFGYIQTEEYNPRDKLYTYFDDTVDYVCYIPAGIVVMLGGTTYTLEKDYKVVIPNASFNMGVLQTEYQADGVTTASKGALVYLQLVGGNIVATASSVLLEPSDYSVLFGICTIGTNGELWLKQPHMNIVLDSHLLSYLRVGSAVPYTRGYATTAHPGDAQFFRTGDVI